MGGCFVCLFYPEGSFHPGDISVISMALFRAASLVWAALSVKENCRIASFLKVLRQKPASRDAVGLRVNWRVAATWCRPVRLRRRRGKLSQ